MLKVIKMLSLSAIAAVIVFTAAPIPANAAAAPLLNGIVSIDGNHALDDKGVLWTWNEATYEAVPVLEDVKTISEGNAAVKKDGTVWTWGRKTGNVTGPDGKVVYFNTFDQPTKVEGLSGAVDISGNYVLKADGTVWSVSGGCEYQLSNEACAAEASVEEKLRPGRIGELKDIVAIADGGNFPLALAKDGTLWIWGQDRYGDSFLPVPLLDRKDAKPTDFKGAASISTGLAMSSSWDIYTINRFAIYGVASAEFNVAKLAPNVAAVSGAGGDFNAFSFVLMKDGTVSYWIWPTADKKLFPVKGLGQVKSISAKSEGGGTALHRDGTISSWGRMNNYYGDDKYKYNHTIVPKKIIRGIGIRLNGKYQIMENQPAMINGSVFVPVRGLFESLGGSVDYSNNIVTVKYGTSAIRMEVWKQEANINGVDMKLPVPVQIVRGSTMAPLRFVAQAMGAEVVWDGKSQEVLLASK